MIVQKSLCQKPTKLNLPCTIHTKENECPFVIAHPQHEKRISSSPLATIVILVYLGSAVVPAVILSMLYPLRLNSPDILFKRPGLLCTKMEYACFLIFYPPKTECVLFFIILTTVYLFVKILFCLNKTFCCKCFCT